MVRVGEEVFSHEYVERRFIQRHGNVELERRRAHRGRREESRVATAIQILVIQNAEITDEEQAAGQCDHNVLGSEMPLFIRTFARGIVGVFFNVSIVAIGSDGGRVRGFSPSLSIYNFLVGVGELRD